MNPRQTFAIALGLAVLSIHPIGFPLHAQAPSAPATPPPSTPPPIVRAIEIVWPGASAAEKNRLLARFHTHIGQPYSEELLEEDIRLALAVASAPNAPTQPTTYPAVPPAPIVRGIEIDWPEASAARKKKLLAHLRTRIGQPYSEKAIEEDIRHVFYETPLGGRVFGEPVPGGIKVVYAVRRLK